MNATNHVPYSTSPLVLYVTKHESSHTLMYAVVLRDKTPCNVTDPLVWTLILNRPSLAQDPGVQLGTLLAIHLQGFVTEFSMVTVVKGWLRLVIG